MATPKFMIQFTTKPGTTVLAIEVHKSAENFTIENPELGETFQSLCYYSCNNIDPTVICLPPNQWQYIGTTETITEEQAAKLVLMKRNRYKASYKYYGYGHYGLAAIDSLRSAIKAHGGNPDSSVYAILKLINNE